MGVPIGIMSAVRKGSWADRAGMVFALLGVSMPVFWLGHAPAVFLLVSTRVGPPEGARDRRVRLGGDRKGKFILPWITLAFTSAAFYARMVRGNLIETMTEDYIRTARAKGLAERTVIYKHGLRAR